MGEIVPVGGERDVAEDEDERTPELRSSSAEAASESVLGAGMEPEAFRGRSGVSRDTLDLAQDPSKWSLSQSSR